MTGRVWILTDSRYLKQRMPTALADALRDRTGIEVRVVQTDGRVSEVGGLDGFTPQRGDVVVPRTRHPYALWLLSRAELARVASLSSSSAIAGVRDKPQAALVLAAAGVPTPCTFVADTPTSLRSLPRSVFPLLLKPPLGDNAEGIIRVDEPDELERLGWPHGMVLAQCYVDVAGVDLKIYGAGDQLWAVRRRSPLLPAGGFDDAVPVPVDGRLRSIARACQEAFGLATFGLDVLPSPRGPLVVDVNDFPNYTGVAEATEVLAELVRSYLGVGVAA